MLIVYLFIKCVHFNKYNAILLEHELMHVGKKGVIPHDAEEFVEIIRKYGIDWART